MQFISTFLDKGNNKPLYLQLYERLAKDIRAKKLMGGERLPSKRAAAQQLGVSVNTVDQAYQMLVAQGYLRAKPKSGFVVEMLQQMKEVGTTEQTKLLYGSSGLNAAPAVSIKDTSFEYSLLSGAGDASLFPLKTWKRIIRAVLAEKQNWYEYGHPQGDEALRSAIAKYIQDYRGVRCEASQIVIGAGLEVLLGLLVHILPEKIAMENPGYSKVKKILELGGAVVQGIALDSEGISTAELVQSGATAVYLTPSHQFPTGVSMPIGRRSELLGWAAQNNGIILEDDYDSVIRFESRPLPSLQGLDNHGKVVYIGTFSRVLAPALRIAYLVLPKNMLQEWNEMFKGYICTVSRTEQQTLAYFIADGHFARSLLRMRTEYKKRREILFSEIDRHFPAGRYKIENAESGLYFLFRVKGSNAAKLAHEIRASGIAIKACSEYTFGNAPTNRYSDALILGYGALGCKDIPVVIERLAKVIAMQHKN